MPTAIWKSRLRSGSAHWDLDCEEEAAGEEAEAEEEGRTALIKSHNPHLAGGEIHKMTMKFSHTIPILPYGNRFIGGHEKRPPAVRAHRRCASNVTLR